MFEVGFSELIMVGLVALLVVGPERLPQLARIDRQSPSDLGSHQGGNPRGTGVGGVASSANLDIRRRQGRGRGNRHGTVGNLIGQWPRYRGALRQPAG